MGTAVQTAFDYSALERVVAESLREKTGEIRELARSTTEGIVRLGGALSEVRDMLAYGLFDAWLAAEFNWSRRTAYNLINVHEAFGCANFAQLTIDVSALYLLAAPSTPEPVRQAVVERAQQGERITHAVAKEAVREFHPKLEKAMADYVAKHTTTPAAAVLPPQPKAVPLPVVPLASRPQFLRLTEAESDWQVDLRDCLNVIDNTPYQPDRAVVLLKDFGISKARIQKAATFFSRLEAEYES